MEESYEKSIFEEEQIQVVYAGFWERFAALFLDGLILLSLTGINLYNHTHWKSIAVLIIASLAAITYKPLLEYLYGATTGKRALAIAVINTAYEKPNLGEALLRNIFGVRFGLLSLVSSVFVFTNAQFSEVSTMADYSNLEKQVGYTLLISILIVIIYIADAIVLLADKQKRALHDFIAKTYVIKK